MSAHAERRRDALDTVRAGLKLLCSPLIARTQRIPGLADTEGVGIQNALKLGLGGYAVDLLLYGMPNGLGLLGGAIVGLFMPDARSLDAVYDPAMSVGSPASGLGLFDGLFGSTEGRPQDPPARPQRLDAKTLLASGLAAALFSRVGGFSLPLYGAYLAGALPYNHGGLTPLLWSSGVIPPSLGGLWRGWGAMAGVLT